MHAANRFWHLTESVFRARAGWRAVNDRGNASFTGQRYRCCMWRHLKFVGFPGPALAWQANLERAGCALACAYSSADEFEAAVIRANMHAGIYGPKRYIRLALYA